MSETPTERLRPSPAEENYLKEIFKYSESGTSVSTSKLSKALKTTPASVTDMIKKMSEKGLLDYRPYHGVKLTNAGQQLAVDVIRKRRLWETFLVQHLNFKWDQVHEIAEQLEHVHSEELISRLDTYLEHPRIDPHGDPIPDAEGNFLPRNTKKLTELDAPERVEIAGVAMHTPEFLRYLDRLGLAIGTQLEVAEHIPFDNSILVRTSGREIILNESVANHLLVVALG
ncbi:MAG: metal-dependent transcriptional regulator [Bacteroidota bacterium]